MTLFTQGEIMTYEEFEKQLRETVNVGVDESMQRVNADKVFVELQKQANEIVIQSLLFLKRAELDGVSPIKSHAAIGAALGAAVANVERRAPGFDVLKTFEGYLQNSYGAVISQIAPDDGVLVNSKGVA